MKWHVVERNGVRIAVADGDGTWIADVQSALDLLASAYYEAGADRIALAKERIADAFFDLRTGLAGEVLQKFVNYRTRVAIYGDFSPHPGRALRDFIRESNEGDHVFFAATGAEAIDRLAGGR